MDSRARLRRLSGPLVMVGVVLVVGVAVLEQTRFGLVGWSTGFSTLVALGAVAVGTVLVAFTTWLSVRSKKREREVVETMARELEKERKLVQIDGMRKDQERELAESMIDELEREREVMQTTIDQLKADREKAEAIAMIASHLDDLHAKLPHEMMDGCYDDERLAFHPGERVDEPGEDVPEDVFAEIEARYPSLSTDIRAFNRGYEEYSRRRERLESELATFFERTFTVAFGEDDREFLEYVLDSEGVEATPERYVATHAGRFAEHVLRGTTGSGLPAYFWSVSPVTPVEMREEEFADEFAELRQLFRSYKDRYGTLDSGLERAREEWKDEFGIRESEIERRA